MEVNKRLFKRLSDFFKDNIKLSFIAEENVIIVTKDDKVYQFDELVNETYSSIAYTCDESVNDILINKSIVEELCNKDIEDIRSGKFHTIVRNSDGKVYVWGKNFDAVLGNGENDSKTYRPQLNEYLNDLNITDMSCGVSHTLVLTSSGDIYGWGDNECGQIGNGTDSECQLIPFKINCLLSEKFKAISCGNSHSMALTEDGRVFSCGYNKDGQLGNGSFTNSNKLNQIDMNDIIVEKISCGERNSLLLSNEGEIYVLGKHFTKNLRVNSSKPQKLNQSNAFCDIATHWSHEISAALSKNGIYYNWGQLGEWGQILYEPKETIYKSFNEIFINYSQKTYKPIEEMIVQFEDSFNRHLFFEFWYRVEEKLGEGSNGEVFKVKSSHSQSKSEVKSLKAIKKIKFKNDNEKDVLKELKTITLMKKIEHKNIVSYEDFWIEKFSKQKHFSLYIEMELCKQTLTDFIKKIEELEFKATNFFINSKYFISSAVFIEILEGVNYLHKQNPPIIHRDLWPNNILFTKKNDKILVKIADFGLATIHKFVEQTHKSDVEHIEYLAPEVFNGGIYDTRADIYSLGIILNGLFDIKSENK
jgi:alpha-tubulin suppressor-like RCC1 family protein